MFELKLYVDGATVIELFFILEDVLLKKSIAISYYLFQTIILFN